MRWSSENDREDASHYIELEFPEEISVSFVVLKWERRNVTSYALDESVRVKFLRLSTYAVLDRKQGVRDGARLRYCDEDL